MARPLAGLLGLAVVVLHLYAGWSIPQFRDHITAQGFAEVTAWRTGQPVPASGYGPSRGSQCGMVYLTHHPLLASYVALAGELIGIPAPRVIAAGVAVAAGILVAALVLACGWLPALVVAAAMGGSLLLAPGYGQWLEHPIGHSWAVATVYLIGAAALCRRPLWPMVGAVLLASWVSIDATFVFAGMVAGALIAAQGFGRRTIAAGLASVAVFLVGNLAHLAQVWCHCEWDWALFRANYVTGIGVPGDGMVTSLMTRVTTLPLAERVAMATQWLPAYWHEALANEHGHWTTPGFWAVALACSLAMPVTWRGVAGAALCVLGAAATAVVAPGLMPPHLIYLPRYIIVTWLGALICLGAGTTAPMRA